jgi:nicotinamidase-related amidase
MVNNYPKTLTLHLRSQFLGQRPGKYNAWQVSMVEKTLPYSQVAMIVCDMWDNHWSLGAAERVNAMAPRMNAVLEIARARGAAIIHAPSDTMEYYSGSPARERALGVPKISPPAEIKHKDFLLPVDDTDGGSDTGETVEKRVWTCQHSAIHINQEKDYISDDGLQVWAILKYLDISHLLIMGVHTNMCILNRSFAIKQMVRWGMPVALVRDLTDSLYNPARPPYVSHDWGTALVVDYIEKFWCPTIASTNLFSTPL